MAHHLSRKKVAFLAVDGVRGRTSLRTGIENAGGTWVDGEVCVDQRLVSSRGPQDPPAFCRQLVEAIGEGRHGGRTRASAGAGRPRLA